MATSEGIPSSIDIEFLELNDNPYLDKAIPGGILYSTLFILVVFPPSISPTTHTVIPQAHLHCHKRKFLKTTIATGVM